MKNMNWILLLGFAGVAYYAYREITRTKTVYVDSLESTRLANVISATA